MKFKDPPKSEVDAMRELVRSAIWTVLYHEGELCKAHVIAACAEVMRVRGNYPFTMAEALKCYDDDNDNPPKNPEEWAKYTIGEAANGIVWHENALVEAHATLAVTKMMLVRGNYTEIDLDEITKVQKSRLSEED